ncbi:conserved hypothetical protein [Hyella patelloides LEGE 07179]|uniref:DUF433 domain-containing protein n=1 Tax=Hyella patelloides LEGE 07179 TaxID=945734 RepID=A0A563VX72_9CYAN|nr:DUF433 domain-containing protein [Hyella patelloides]VEP16011.1 conserved hypothetical protein [Hyella patelloides LEGE 07179]
MELSHIPHEQSIIHKTPGICGGYACIRNTRIPVWTLVALRKQGATEQELLKNYPDLSLDDLTTVWGYYYNNKSEIDRAITEMDN